MRDRPILFSSSMVRAILDGRKTQTRMVVKPQPLKDVECGPGSEWRCAASGGTLGNPFSPGTRLWVRETWGMSYVDVAKDRPHVIGGTWGSQAHLDRKPCVVFRADGDEMPDDSPYETARWSPSIHMPRWASRITLEIESVRVERLQEISREDAIAEGWDPQWRSNEIVDEFRPLLWYGNLWCSINGPGSWDSNPWVWVIQFRRISKKGGAS